MSNSLQVFSNSNFSVRTINEDGKIWFVAKDVAEALEYPDNTLKQVNNLCGNVPEEWKGHKRIMTPGGEQEMLCLTEEGLYFFLGRSDKPKALPYQVWIAGDVVPSIRATGSYSLNKEQPALSAGVIECARIIFESAGLEGNQMTLALDKIYQRHMGYSALQNSDIELIAPENKQLLTPTEIGRQLGLSPRRVNEILAGAGYQYKIAGNWEPLTKASNYAVMLDTNKKHSDGTPVRQLKWKSEIISLVKERME